MLSSTFTISTSLPYGKFQSLHKSRHVKPSLALRPVTQGEDELYGKRTEVQPLECKVDPVRNLRCAEEVVRGIWEKTDDDAERKPQVGKSEPGEDEGEDVILQAEAQVSIILDGRIGRKQE